MNDNNLEHREIPVFGSDGHLSEAMLIALDYKEVETLLKSGEEAARHLETCKDCRDILDELKEVGKDEHRGGEKMMN